MSRVIISSVGTSLIVNLRKQQIDPTDEKAVFNYMSEHTAPASAETNALSRVALTGDSLYFLASETAEGELCGRLLAEFYRAQGFVSEFRLIRGLSSQSAGFVQYGLRNYVQELSDIIIKAQRKGQAIEINNTGGFKAQIAYANVVGLIFRIPVFYIHENFKDIIYMPKTPIQWDMSLFYENEIFFEWLEADLRTHQDVKQRQESHDERIQLLLDENADGYTYLSPLGLAYLSAFKDEVDKHENTPIWLSHQATRDWQGFDASTREKFSRVIRPLRIEGLRRAQTKQMRQGDAPVFPQGHRDERVYFIEHEEADKKGVCILEFTRHGWNYEKLYTRGVFRHEYLIEKFTLINI